VSDTLRTSFGLEIVASGFPMKFVPKLDAKIDFPLFRPGPNRSPRDDDALVGDDTADEESQRAGMPAATFGAAAKPAALDIF